MITFLEGTITEKHPTRVVLDVGGVGYEIFIPLSSFGALPQQGQRCRLLTYDYVREDSHQLFGFMTEPERTMFMLLMTTNGIGPKLALSALSSMAVSELREAITRADLKRLGCISGIGKKLAERIVVELRDKLAKDETGMSTSVMVAGLYETEAKLRDAVLALIELGYSQAEARRMIEKKVASEEAAGLSVEEILKRALGGGRR